MKHGKTLTFVPSFIHNPLAMHSCTGLCVHSKMGLKVILLRLLHSLTLILYASVTWLFASFFDIKHVFDRYWNGGLNSTASPFLYADKTIQNLDHIAFVIYEDDLSIPTLCQLVLICINLQVGDISVTAKSRRLSI